MDNTKSNGWGVLEDGTTHSLGGSTDAVVYDALANGEGDTAPNLTGDHANRITDYTPVVVRVGGDFNDPSYTIDDKAFLASTPMSDRQMMVIQQNAVGDPDVANGVDTKVRGNFDQQDGPAIVAVRSTGAGFYSESEVASVRAQTGGTTYDMITSNATVRRLTPTECERLQAFPDGWTDQQADTPRYKQLGNAVCVNVVEFIARRLPQEGVL